MSQPERKERNPLKKLAVRWRTRDERRGTHVSGRLEVESSTAPGERLIVVYDSRGRVSQHQINIDTNTGAGYGVNMPAQGNNTIVLNEPGAEKQVAQIVSTGTDIYVFLGSDSAGITVK